MYDPEMALKALSPVRMTLRQLGALRALRASIINFQNITVHPVTSFKTRFHIRFHIININELTSSVASSILSFNIINTS